MTEPGMTELATQLAADLPQGDARYPVWFGTLRQSAAEQFCTHGLPTRRDEAWKYTGLRRIEESVTRLVIAVESANSAPASPMVEVEHQITIVDGYMRDSVGDLPPGLTLLPLKDALDQDVAGLQALLESLPQQTQASADGFSALNTSMMKNSIVIQVAAGIDAGRVLLNWSTTASKTGRLFNTRVCLILDAGAKLELLEQFESPQANTNTSNIVIQADLAANASLHHVRLQQESDQAGLITRTEISQQADSEYSYFGFDLGGGLVRHDLHSRLQGRAAKASLNGAYLLDGNRHVDNHAKVDHMALDGYSEQYFRGVAGERGRAVFNTAVYVHPGADGTEAKQSNANILLSKQAEIDTKPELEIYADDVIASHGATVGQLDESAIFYLRSRGLDEEQSRQLLTTAFCRSVSDKLTDPKLAEAISQRMMDVMPQTS
jgi:Fe-S cluster assembly protein SufD